MAVFLLSTLLLPVGLLLVWWVHRPRLVGVPVPQADPPDHPPLVSVIVPARNEAANIRRCVDALRAQTYPRLELLVVDDRSTDDTPRILAELAASEPRLRVIQGKPLPAGWVGKPHALHQGAQAARGSLLCFMDADTFAEPALIASTVRAMQAHQADLFTIMTRQEMGSFWEKVLLPVVFTGLALGFDVERVHDPDDPLAIANGQFILIRRAVYQAVGGHAAIRASIVEDKDLAERVKHAGYRLVLGDGRALATTRMYTSLGEMWEGWTKNVYLGTRGRPGLLLFGAFASLLGAFVLPGTLIASLLWAWHGGGGAAWGVFAEASLLTTVLLYQRGRFARLFDISAAWGLTFPLGAALTAAIILTSAFLVLSGRGVTWKGRRYPSPPP